MDVQHNITFLWQMLLTKVTWGNTEVLVSAVQEDALCRFSW